MKITLLLALLILPTFSFAESESRILAEEILEGPVSDPAIKEFQVQVRHFENFFDFMEGAAFYDTNIAAKIETKRPEDLKKYVVVQYIRGCIFEAKENPDKSIKYSLPKSRGFFGRSIIFRHADWVVDSTDVDPVYWSGTEIEGGEIYGRNGLYRLDNPLVSQKREEYRFFYKDHKKQTAMYISDSPTGASYDRFGGGYENSSLEFRTCLFRASDVPTKSDPEGRAIKKEPIKCHYWQSNFQYNFESKTYERPSEIHPFCLLKSSN